MHCPEQYIKDNGMQRRDARDISNIYIEKMVWKSNEIVLDLGCGPGDVTSDILYPFLKNKINQLVGVDKSIEMVEFAKKNYGCSKMDFKVLDIENAHDCSFYSHTFNKIFSFFCFHWVHNKVDSLLNMHLMLKSGGEILVNFMLINPLVELYKCMDTEWQIYIKDIKQMSQNVYSQDEIRDIFTKAGFRIINLESSIKKYTFPDFPSLLSAVKAVDVMYNILPQHLHDRYSMHVKDKICERQMVQICPITGKIIKAYLPITVHAVKD
ncbi:LOW QUALITY PROTEIN: juvenile hormone acid O-methyltransferase-like [Metopolophium dirhodum]|uniref:LOW QUALITY PROTEIN: juvenile hormone acid O-methyltransferase-like n=1 Tax=Metopolophium dirhodum TaxID=44670 RepID=UPI0029906B7A|nr:LOW QUALITY PROTEIN: juvenile hormone acid O-methyltransferase-like [Metopolophium dirhodum]